MQHVHLASEINGRSISLGSEEGEGEATKAGYQLQVAITAILGCTRG